MLTETQVRRMMKVSNISTMMVSAICLVLWLAVTVYYGTWDTSETSWDLLSVCAFEKAPPKLTCVDLGHVHIKTMGTRMSDLGRPAPKW